MYTYTCTVHVAGYMRNSEMEGERQGRPPTVVPLTTELIQKLLQQQQQQRGAVLSAAKQVSQALTARMPGIGSQSRGSNSTTAAGSNSHQLGRNGKAPSSSCGGQSTCLCGWLIH